MKISIVLACGCRVATKLRQLFPYTFKASSVLTKKKKVLIYVVTTLVITSVLFILSMDEYQQENLFKFFSQLF